MAEYTTSHIVQLFNVAPQSVRNWSEQFARYLSSTAAPGRGRNRTFTAEDVSVFAVIAAMKKNNASNEEIHASLAAGIRGSLPDLPAPADIQMLVVSDHAKALATLTQKIEALEVERDTALTELQKAKEEISQLRVSYEGRLNDRDEQLRAAQEKIDKLNREIGKLESRLED